MAKPGKPPPQLIRNLPHWYGSYAAAMLAVWGTGLSWWWVIPVGLAIGSIVTVKGRLPFQALLSRIIPTAAVPSGWIRPATWLVLDMTRGLDQLPVVLFQDAAAMAAGLPSRENSVEEGPARCLLPGDGGLKAGVIVRLDASRLASMDALTPTLAADAIGLAFSKHVPRGQRNVYFVVDGLDCLYGLRTLAGLVGTTFLNQPLGAMRTGPGNAGEFAAMVVRRSTSRILDLTRSVATKTYRPHATLLQLPGELLRLKDPLRLLAEAVERTEAVEIRGVFLLASATGGSVLPPSLTGITGFNPVPEPEPANLPWFVGDLFTRRLPADTAIMPGPIRKARWAGWMYTLLVTASIMVAWHIYRSHGRASSLLLSAAGRVAPPAVVADLEPLLVLNERAGKMRPGLVSPGRMVTSRFSTEVAERFSEGYHDLVLLPELDTLQEAAREAAKSGDSGLIGPTLLRLTLLRGGLDRAGGADTDNVDSVALSEMAVQFGLIPAHEARLMAAYACLSKEKDWMQPTRQVLADWEEYLLRHANGGDLTWLAAWLNSLIRERSEDRAFPDRIGIAWTLQGYRFSEALLAAVAAGKPHGFGPSERTQTYLAWHRSQALQAWLEEARIVLDRDVRRLTTGDLRRCLREYAEGRDPVKVFGSAACRNLLPMFDEEHQPLAVSSLRRWASVQNIRCENDIPDRGDDQPPEQSMATSVTDPFSAALERAADLSPMENLRVVQECYLDAQSLALVPDSNPLHRVRTLLEAEPADSLDESPWRPVAPAARHHDFCRLATELAARSLDALWREQVWLSARLDGKNGEETGMRQFLTGPAAGFWCYDGTTLKRSTYNGIGFPFSEPFLTLCSNSAARGFQPPPQQLSGTLHVEAVQVDKAARERPVAVDFAVRLRGGEKTVTYRNYPVSGELTFNRDDMAAAVVRLHFPSVVAEAVFSGPDGLRQFALMVGHGGSVELYPESFGTANAALRAIGVTKITARARLDPLEPILYCLAEGVELPVTILSE